MRMHTFEKEDSLENFFSVIKKIIKLSFRIDESSYVDELHLLCIGISKKNQSVIIRGSIDEPKNRIYLSILAVNNSVILKERNTLKNNNNFPKELGKILFDIVKNRKENEKNFTFSDLAIKKPRERNLLTQLAENEKKILIKLLHTLEERENDPIILGKYPFSLIDMDGSWEIWQNIYGSYIDLVENNLIVSKNGTLRTFRNYNFALNSAHHQRIADLVTFEVEEQISKPVSNKSANTFKKSYEKIEAQYSDEVEKKGTFKINFVFTNKKRQQLKLMRMLKLSSEVKNFTQLLHKNVLKQYSKIESQIIFISLFGFEATIGEHLRNNLYGNLNGNLSILIIPPIDNNLWNNSFVTNSISSENDYKHKLGMSFEDFSNMRKNGAINRIQVKEMETYYNDLLETKKSSDYNSQQIKFWADILSINNSSELLDIEDSRMQMQELVIE